MMPGFTAYLVGDVTGNWQNGFSPLSGGDTFSTDTDGVLFALPTLTEISQPTLEVPLSIADIGSHEILAYEMTLAFDATVVQLADITLPDALHGYWTLVHQISPQKGGINYVQIAAYSSTPMQPSTGAVENTDALTALTLQFEVIGERADETPLDIREWLYTI